MGLIYQYFPIIQLVFRFNCLDANRPLDMIEYLNKDKYYLHG